LITWTLAHSLYICIIMINTEIILNFIFKLNGTIATCKTFNLDCAKRDLANHYYNEDKLVKMIYNTELSMNNEELDEFTAKEIWSNSFSTLEVIVKLQIMPE
jgi:hypothetical protein